MDPITALWLLLVGYMAANAVIVWLFFRVLTTAHFDETQGESHDEKPKSE
jgi:hypothetical protein